MKGVDSAPPSLPGWEEGTGAPLTQGPLDPSKAFLPPGRSVFIMVTPAEGEMAVRLARSTLEETLSRIRGKGGPPPRGGPAPLPSLFGEKRGVFVTLKTTPSPGELRGCIGFPLPLYPLARGIPLAALHAAREDPRFPPVAPEELPHLTVEVSILTSPEPIPSSSPGDLLREVVVGRDGLIATSGSAQGLLLPQVPVELGWDVPAFLSGTCEKAGLPADAWRRGEVRFQRFRSEVFREREPRGDVIRVLGLG